MLYDGLSLAEGTAVSNLTIASGTSNPTSPSTGELFYRTDSPNEGLYVYSGAEWQAVGSGNVSFDALNVKPAVRAATTANITLSGTQTVDGVSLTVGDRVLVKNQNTGSQNGIYVVASSSWTRATDFDGAPSTEVKAGDFVFVTEGTTYADTGWVLTTNGTITVGTTALTFAQFTGSAPASLTASYVGYGSGSNLLTGSSNLTWNNTSRVLTLAGGASTVIGSGGMLTVSGAEGGGHLMIKGGRSGGSVAGGDLYVQGGDSLNVGQGGNNAGPTLYLRSGSGGGDIPYPGSIVFQTHNIGAVPITWIERMRMTGSGALSFGTSGTAYGTAGQILTSNGDAPPSWQNAPATFTGGTVANATTFSSSVTLSSSLIFGTAYTETNTNVTATASTTLNCATGNNFAITLGTSITTLTFSNVPTSGRVYNMSLVILQSGAGSFTINWPGSVKWPSGGAPALTSTSGKYDIITLMTYDGGTNWFGFVAGQNY